MTPCRNTVLCLVAQQHRRARSRCRRRRDGARRRREAPATGTDLDLVPTVVEPGPHRLRLPPVRKSDPAGDATYTFDVTSRPAEEAFSASGDLIVQEVTTAETRIVGVLRNAHEEEVAGPLNVQALCFGLAGELLAPQLR